AIAITTACPTSPRRSCRRRWRRSSSSSGSEGDMLKRNRTRHAWLALGVAVLAGACTETESKPPASEPSSHSGTTVSSTLALTPDDGALWVVNQDADSVSVIDTKTRALLAEIPLGTAPPAVDPVTQRFDPAIAPRSLAI